MQWCCFVLFCCALRPLDTFNASNFVLLLLRYPADSTTWELLYRATRDGFGASDFHALCDGDFATITVVRTPGGHVFGGVREIGYGGTGNSYVTTDKAFVYGIRTHGSPDAPVVFLPTKNLQWGIEQQSGTLGAWGGGHALKIGTNANLPSKQAGVDCPGICSGFSDSHSNPGATFTGNGITHHDTDAGHEYLAGSWYFSLTEIETYKIVEPPFSPGPGVNIQHVGTASSASNSGGSGGKITYSTMTLDLNRGRKVVVALSGRQRVVGLPTLSNTAVTATVVGGSGGVLQFSRLAESPGSTGSMFTEIWAIDLDDAVDTGSGGPASATLEVSINYGSKDAYGSLISLWQLYGAAGPGSAAAFGIEAGTATDATGVITVPALGGLVCFADTTGPDRSFVWSGVKEDFDERFTGQHHSAASGASGAFPTGAKDHQITCDQGATTVRMVCAAFGSAD